MTLSLMPHIMALTSNEPITWAIDTHCTALVCEMRGIARNAAIAHDPTWLDSIVAVELNHCRNDNERQV
jgi:hypothetical protein